MKKISYKVKLTLTVLFVAVSVVNGIAITIYNVGRSAAVGGNSDTVHEVKKSCSKISEAISSKDSLIDVYKISEEKGFTADVKVLYFTQDGSLAQAR